MEKQKPEYYKQDDFQAKVKSIEKQIESRLGKKTLELIHEYAFREANLWAKIFEIDKISDELEKQVAFGRLCRFKTEHAVLEAADWIEHLHSSGYSDERIKEYITPTTLAEVICFE